MKSREVLCNRLLLGNRVKEFNLLYRVCDVDVALKLVFFFLSFNSARQYLNEKIDFFSSKGIGAGSLTIIALASFAVLAALAFASAGFRYLSLHFFL
jgi:hypothetical protein